MSPGDPDGPDGPLSSDVPVDRLTDLTAEMTEVLERPENADVKAIVFLNDGETGGIQVYGYETTGEAMADLFVNIKAIFQSMGKDIDFVGIPDSPEGLS